MERMWVTRLRWRMRGAWQWPCFLALTVVDGLLLRHLPVEGDGPGTLVAALLLAGFLNLFVVAALAPLAGRRLRRRRGDLPRAIADNYAGTLLLGLVAVGLALGGLAHRPALAAEHDDEAAAFARVHDYVVREGEPQYRVRVGQIDLLRLKQDYYRSCVPGDDPRLWLCLYVNTDQRPAGVVRDTERVPNSSLRMAGGFR
jgi:hypothetical protein